MSILDTFGKVIFIYHIKLYIVKRKHYKNKPPHTRTDASRAPLFLIITIISASLAPSSPSAPPSAPSAMQKSDASRAASPPDRQERGDSEVRLAEKKREAPEGACFLILDYLPIFVTVFCFEGVKFSYS